MVRKVFARIGLLPACLVLLGAITISPTVADVRPTVPVLLGAYSGGIGADGGQQNFDTSSGPNFIYSEYTDQRAGVADELDGDWECSPLFTCAKGQIITLAIYNADATPINLMSYCNTVAPGPEFARFSEMHLHCVLETPVSVRAGFHYILAASFPNQALYGFGTGVSGTTRTECTVSPLNIPPPDPLPSSSCTSGITGQINLFALGPNQDYLPLGTTQRGPNVEHIGPNQVVAYPFVAGGNLNPGAQLPRNQDFWKVSSLGFFASDFTSSVQWDMGIMEAGTGGSGGTGVQPTNQVIRVCNNGPEGVTPGWNNCTIDPVTLNPDQVYFLVLVNDDPTPGNQLNIQDGQIQGGRSGHGLVATDWGMAATDLNVDGIPDPWLDNSNHIVGDIGEGGAAMYAAYAINDVELPGLENPPIEVPQAALPVALGDSRAEPNQLTIPEATYQHTAWPVTAAQTETVDRFWLLTKNPASSPTYSVCGLCGIPMALFDDVGGQPQNQLAECITNPVPQFPDSNPHWIDCVSNNPVQITQGQQYWLDVADGDGGDSPVVYTATTSPDVSESGSSILSSDPWDNQTTAYSGNTEPGPVSFFMDNDGRTFTTFVGNYSATVGQLPPDFNANSAGPSGTNITCSGGGTCVSVGSASNMPKYVSWNYTVVNNNSFDVPVDIFFDWRSASGSGTTHSGPVAIVAPKNSTTNSACDGSEGGTTGANDCATVFNQPAFLIPSGGTTAAYGVEIYDQCNGSSCGNVTVNLTLTWYY